MVGLQSNADTSVKRGRKYFAGNERSAESELGEYRNEKMGGWQSKQGVRTRPRRG